MGTFHADKGELHGITVVVETHGDRVYVGRCHEENEQNVVLLDVDHHDGDEASRSAYLEKAAQFGTWKKLDHVALPRSEVRSIRRLAELG